MILGGCTRTVEMKFSIGRCGNNDDDDEWKDDNNSQRPDVEMLTQQA